MQVLSFRLPDGNKGEEYGIPGGFVFFGEFLGRRRSNATGRFDNARARAPGNRDLMQRLPLLLLNNEGFFNVFSPSLSLFLSFYLL